MATTNRPLLTRAERQRIHDLESPRALIIRRLAMREPAWFEHDRIIPDAPDRQPVEFGRALEWEQTQDAPIGPSNPPMWRMMAVITACGSVIGLALVGLFVLLRGALRLLGVL